MDEVLNPSGHFPVRPTEDLVTETAQGYYVRGSLRVAHEQWDDGIADLETGQRLDPEFGLIPWLLGIVYGKRGDDHRALQAFERAHQLFTLQHNSQMAASSQRQASKIRKRLANT